ncbi:hypothetical protein BT63DRAFT_459940 [Microthyrium microscopicum]|uniref:Uncharacterized protein n=1 Tax=Microthyrium microscopicum TaxID=703497 RepID=A0A6A6TXB6_9PEZI|nr:hypothetical protein BT63DRAFT_459940 [Microthyrium microscopicum]
MAAAAVVNLNASQRQQQLQMIRAKLHDRHHEKKQAAEKKQLTRTEKPQGIMPEKYVEQKKEADGPASLKPT